MEVLTQIALFFVGLIAVAFFVALLFAAFVAFAYIVAGAVNLIGTALGFPRSDQRNADR